MSDKILLLSHVFPPYVFPESYLIAKCMGNIRNVEIDVITTKAFLSSVKEDNDFLPYTNARFANVKRVTPPSFYKYFPFHRLKSVFLLPDLYRWLNYLYFKHLRNLSEYKAIVSWSMYHSSHLLGLRAKKNFPSIPWIAHFSDPWTTNPFFKQNILVKIINKYLEKKVFEKADVLLFTSEETINSVLKDYPANVRRKAYCIPHAYDDKLYPEVEESSNHLKIRYIGGFYGARQPTPLFRALEIIQAQDPKILENISIELIGSNEVTVKDFDSLRNIVQIKDSVNYLTSLKLMKNADLLLIIDAPAIESVFLPSKLVDYIGANRPIFGITPAGTSQKLLERLGCLTANPDNPQEIAKNLLIMIQKVKQGKVKIPQKVRQEYSIETVGEQMLKILKDCDKLYPQTSNPAYKTNS